MESRVKKVDWQAAHKPSMQQPEWDFYNAQLGKNITLTFMNGLTVKGVLIQHSTYTLILQRTAVEFPVMYFKHALLSMER